MSPELEQAVRERIELGHTKEQITAELHTAGYEATAIEQIYTAVHTATATTVSGAPVVPGLIGYRALITASFALVASQWKLLLVSALYSLVWLVVFGGLLMVAAQLSTTSVAAGLALAAVTMVGGVVGFFSLSFGFKRALLMRAQNQSYLSYVRWATKNLLGLFLVSICVQFATTLGYVAMVIPGIALSLYLGFAMFVRLTGAETGVMALVRSTQIVYGRWWGMLGRMLFAILMFILCTLPVLLFVGISLGSMDLNLLVAGDTSLGVTSLLLLLGLLLVAAVLFVAFMMQCAMVVLFESLRATATPFTPAGEQRLYFWMKVMVVVGIIPTVLLSALDSGTTTPLSDDLVMPGQDELMPESMHMDPEAQAEMEAFMQKFDAAFDAY